MDEAELRTLASGLLRLDHRAAADARRRLAEAGDEAVPHLAAILTHGDRLACDRSAEVLALIGTDSSAEALAREAFPPRDDDRARAARLALM